MEFYDPIDVLRRRSGGWIPQSTISRDTQKPWMGKFDPWAEIALGYQDRLKSFDGVNLPLKRLSELEAVNAQAINNEADFAAQNRPLSPPDFAPSML